MELKDRPPMEIIAPTLLRSVGVRVEKTGSGMKFIYRPDIVRELDQIGFSLNVLKMTGGEVPLPILQQHLDEQSTLEAYWSAQAETARYKYSVASDNWDFWFENKYAECFNELQNNGVPKPTEKEVKAIITKTFPKNIKKKKERLRRLEWKYRMLNNCCYASIVTKGKMLQSLRNVIQGSQSVRIPSVETEELGTVDPSNIVAKSSGR